MAIMEYLDRKKILNTLIKHETLLIDDLIKVENLGIVLKNNEYLKYLLIDLIRNGFIIQLDGVTPDTYTITEKGIAEGKRLVAEQLN
jgi:predicted transcriptional regulator